MEHGTPSMTSGSLRTKISLKGGYSQLALVCPFYGMKQELPEASPILGSDDLLAYYDLSGTYSRYCAPKRLREDLASFLPQVCGTSNLNSRSDNTCSLRKLVENPPIIGKEIVGLSASQMVGFKLAPGPVAENFRLFNLSERNAHSSGLPLGDAVPDTSAIASTTSYQEFGQNFNDPEDVKAKHRVKYKHTLDDWEDGESERKAKKPRSDEKEKKEKKQKKKDKKEKKKKKNTEDEPKRRKDETMPFF